LHIDISWFQETPKNILDIKKYNLELPQLNFMNIVGLKSLPGRGLGGRNNNWQNIKKAIRALIIEKIRTKTN
jgi:hypothetical protein